MSVVEMADEMAAPTAVCSVDLLAAWKVASKVASKVVAWAVRLAAS